MEEMFPNGLFVDNRDDMTSNWELEREEDIDYIKATYFVKTDKKFYDKKNEVYTKKIFTKDELEKAIERAGLNILEITKNEKIAGKRWIYILRK